MAAIPSGITRISLTWKPNETDWPSELAVNTFHMQYFPTTPPADWSTALQEIADKVAAVLTARWSSGVSAAHAGGYQITEIGASALDTTGHTIDEAVHAVTSGTLVGTGTSGVLPPEVAIVLGLYNYRPGAFTPRRGTKRGRMYLPYISGAALGSDGKISSATMDNISTGWKNVVDDLDNTTTASGNWQLGILSRTAGTFVSVNYLSVDNHFDSQRRRQHQSPAVLEITDVTHI